MLDLSIIVATTSGPFFTRIVEQIKRQSVDGISYEVVVVQEGGDFSQFLSVQLTPRFEIFRQPLHFDHGAKAHDRGILESRGRYVCFWDDDNIYYPHAMATLITTADNHDIGIVRINHRGLVIPSRNSINPGDIDSMCFCVRRELAVKVQWADGGGRYSDYRWITKISKLATKINSSKIIIGEHL